MNDVRPKTGLVLEGGAMRGMFSAGVIDVFLKEGIKFDAVAGVSAGAAIGVNYPSNQPERFIGYNLRFVRDRRYMGLGSLIKTGNLMNKEFAYYKVPVEYFPYDEETFHKSGIPFYACATNLETGEPEYFEINDFDFGMEVIRASTSLPFVSQPVILNGKPYLDGGVADSIPYDFMFEKGYEKLVVVLTRDAGYVKSPMPALPVKLYYGKYPAFAGRLLGRHTEYNGSVARLEKLEREGRVFIIRPPSPLGIRRTERNLEKMKEVYNRGIEEGKKTLEDVKRFIGEENI